MHQFSGSQIGATSLKLFLTLLVVAFVHYPFFGQTFSESFENGIKDEYWAFEGHNNSTSNKHSTSGLKSYRSYLPLRESSNPRSEIRFRGAKGVPHFQPNRNTFGTRFAIYFPADFTPDETSAEIIAQYHSVPDDQDTYSSPPWALRLRGRTLSVTNRYISKRIASNNDQHEKTWTLKDKIVPGKWHYFVLDMHWDYSADGNGFMKFYMKVGEPPTSADIKINYEGGTGYNDKLGSYFKIGVYKWDWKHKSRVNLSRGQGVTERLLFYDEVSVNINGFMNKTNSSANQKPTVNVGADLTISLDDQDEVLIKGKANDPDGSVEKYLWTQISGPEGITLKNKNSAKTTLQNLVEGIYVLKLTVTDNKGATATDELKVTVKSSPNKPPVVNAGANVTLVLPQNSVTLKGKAFDPNNDDAVESHVWTQSDGPTNIDIENPEQLTINLENLVAGRYVFKLKAYDKSGAEGSDHISIFVLRPEDLPSISASVKDASCNSDNGSIKLTVTGGNSPYSYKWSNGSTRKDLLNVPSGEYEVIVTGSDGWSSSKMMAVDGMTSNLEVEANVKDESCSGSDGSIKLQVSGGLEPYKFEWNNNAARGASLDNLSAGTYTVTVTDQNGCSEKYSYTVNVLPGPTTHDIEATVTNATCAGNDGSISLKVNGTSGPYSFQWTHDVSGPNLNSLEDGVYSVIITDIHGCYMDKSFTINQAPGLAKPKIEQAADTLYVKQEAAAYEWFKDGSKIPGADQRTLRIVEPGTYSLQIANEAGCTASSDYFNAKDPRPYARSLDPTLAFQHFEFYPNPVISDMRVKLSVNQPSIVTLEVLNFQGRTLQAKHVGIVHSQTTESVNVESYPPGIYLIRAKTGDEIITRRFVKP